MTRRLHACLACTGRTRHRAVCGPCRRRGVTVVGDQITVPLRIRFGPTKLFLLPSVNTPHAPTVAELTASGIDLYEFLTPEQP